MSSHHMNVLLASPKRARLVYCCIERFVGVSIESVLLCTDTNESATSCPSRQASECRYALPDGLLFLESASFSIVWNLELPFNLKSVCSAINSNLG